MQPKETVYRVVLETTHDGEVFTETSRPMPAFEARMRFGTMFFHLVQMGALAPVTGTTFDPTAQVTVGAAITNNEPPAAQST